MNGIEEPRFPGFTAEVSLYHKSKSYNTALTGSHVFVHAGSKVLPAGGGPGDPHQCYLDCQNAGHTASYCFDCCYNDKC